MEMQLFLMVSKRVGHYSCCIFYIYKDLSLLFFSFARAARRAQLAIKATALASK